MADYHLVPLQEEHVLQLPLGKLVTLVQLALLHLPRPHQLLLLLQELTVQQGHLLLCVREPPHVRIMRFVQSLYKSSLPQYVLPKKEIFTYVSNWIWHLRHLLGCSIHIFSASFASRTIPHFFLHNICFFNFLARSLRLASQLASLI